MTKKKGGLASGAEAWFDGTPAVAEAPSTPQPAPVVEESEPKTRKTFVILPETYYLLGKMKVEAQREGESATLGTLVDEAVRDLASKRNITQ